MPLFFGMYLFGAVMVASTIPLIFQPWWMWGAK
jgi:hypothetical protein